MAMSEALSNEEVQAAWIGLTEEVRTGVLLTLRNGRPFPNALGWSHADAEPVDHLAAEVGGEAHHRDRAESRREVADARPFGAGSMRRQRRRGGHRREVERAMRLEQVERLAIGLDLSLRHEAGDAGDQSAGDGEGQGLLADFHEGVAMAVFRRKRGRSP